LPKQLLVSMIRGLFHKKVSVICISDIYQCRAKLRFIKL